MISMWGKKSENKRRIREKEGSGSGNLAKRERAGDMSEYRIFRDVKWSSYGSVRNESRRLTGTRYRATIKTCLLRALSLAAARNPPPSFSARDRVESETKLNTEGRKNRVRPSRKGKLEEKGRDAVSPSFPRCRRFLPRSRPRSRLVIPLHTYTHTHTYSFGLFGRHPWNHRPIFFRILLFSPIFEEVCTLFVHC